MLYGKCVFQLKSVIRKFQVLDEGNDEVNLLLSLLRWRVLEEFAGDHTVVI